MADVTETINNIKDLLAQLGSSSENFDSTVDKFTFDVTQHTQFQSFSSETFIKVVVSNTTSITDVENANLLVFDEVLDEATLKTKLESLGIGDRPVFVQYLNEENNSVLVFSQSSEINIVQTFNSQVILDPNNFSFVTGTNIDDNQVVVTTANGDDGDDDDDNNDDDNNDDDNNDDDNNDDDNNDDDNNDDDNNDDDNNDDDNNDDDEVVVIVDDNPTSGNDQDLNIKGTKGDDRLIGSDGNDRIRGDKGNDSIFGGKGDDKITGDKGADQIFYSQLGEGVDRLEDFSREDKLVFNKTVFGNFSTADFTSIVVTSKTQDIGDADLLVFEDKGKDKNQSLDSVLGKLDDLGVGDRPVFALFSEKGNDNKLVFVDGETVDVIGTFKDKTKLQADNFRFVKMKENGEVDEQPVLGTDDDDSLDGSSDTDSCYGGDGQDTLNGGGGGDTFIYLNINEGGDTIINFNINIDVLNFNSTTFGNITNQNFQSIVINNNTTSVGNANFLVFNQEIEVTNLLTILGDLGVNPNRPVFVSAPSEGDDSQTVLYFIQNQEVNIVANFNQNLVLNVNNFNFDNGTSVPGNQIVGTTAKDVLKGTAGNDTIKGLANNDRISGDNGNDYLLGGAGNDNLAGGTGNDSIFGNVGDDKLSGQEGNDYLAGGTGFDHLLAGAGNDILLGGTGGDRLNGGAGNDSLIGGAGKDHFIFNTNEPFKPADFGVDRITDFKVGEDLILLDQRSFNALNSLAGVGFSIASEFAVLTTAVDKSSALIVYNENTGELFYNQNGNANGFGTGGKFAVLENKAVLTADNFQIRVV